MSRVEEIEAMEAELEQMCRARDRLAAELADARAELRAVGERLRQLETERDNLMDRVAREITTRCHAQYAGWTASGWLRSWMCQHPSGCQCKTCKGSRRALAEVAPDRWREAARRLREVVRRYQRANRGLEERGDDELRTERDRLHARVVDLEAKLRPAERRDIGPVDPQRTTAMSDRAARESAWLEDD